MLSFLPDGVTGLFKIRISEHPDSNCDQLRALLGFPENRSPAFWTKVERHGSTAICSTRVPFGDARSEPDLLPQIESLNTESASCPALAFEAVAHGDADGVASNCYLELSATACGLAIRHVNYLSTVNLSAGINAMAKTRRSVRAGVAAMKSQNRDRSRMSSAVGAAIVDHGGRGRRPRLQASDNLTSPNVRHSSASPCSSALTPSELSKLRSTLSPSKASVHLCVSPCPRIRRST